MKQVRVMDIIINWHKNKYLKSLDDFWKVRTLFHYNYIENFLKNKGEISDETIENLFNQASFEFFIDRDKKNLFSHDSQAFKNRFGDLHSISAIDALKNYGITKLEESNEKGYTKI